MACGFLTQLNPSKSNREVKVIVTDVIWAIYEFIIKLLK